MENGGLDDSIVLDLLVNRRDRLSQPIEWNGGHYLSSGAIVTIPTTMLAAIMHALQLLFSGSGGGAVLYREERGGSSDAQKERLL